MVGGETGVFAMVVAVAFSLGTFVEGSFVLFAVIKVTGAGYLVYLGVRAWDRRALAVHHAGEGRARFPARGPRRIPRQRV